MSDNQHPDSQLQTPQRSYASRGAFFGSAMGLFAMWNMVSRSIDPTVLTHKPMFSAVVMFLCIFAIIVFVLLTLFGLLIGYSVKRMDKEPEAEEDLFH